MTLPLSLLKTLANSTPAMAWDAIIKHVLSTMLQQLSTNDASQEVTKRDRIIGQLDLFLASSGWDLWHAFDSVVEQNAERLIQWWGQPFTAKAVLILDGLSLREIPWLVHGVQQRGFTLHHVAAYATELPGETNEFAQALGFTGRNQLQNNGGRRNGRLPNARTESIDLPWHDCINMLDTAPNWIFWHHWPDVQLHHVAGAGQGLDTLTRNVVTQLSSDDFWNFVERLATGRRLIITSDHGYAASGLFSDASGEPATLLKRTFRSGRSASGFLDPGPFVPPVALQMSGQHGPHTLALGRWKWPSAGGYPTLSHGGLSLLEVLSPFVEVTR